jgi:hypothetical protein
MISWRERCPQVGSEVEKILSTQTLYPVGHDTLLNNMLIPVINDEGKYGCFVAEESAKNLGLDG